MREAELWSRLERALGPGYAHAWAEQLQLAELGHRTVIEALAAGLDCKQIWRAAWSQLELDASWR